jgi:hypothetical protein
MLKEGLVSVYKKSKLFKYDFKSFDKDTVSEYIPQVLKLNDLNEESVNFEEEFLKKMKKVHLNKKCQEYLEMRLGLDSMDLEQIKSLRKKIESILIRKNILLKKQKMKQIEKQIQVNERLQ